MSGGWGTPQWMGGDPGEGETFVWGQDRETARGLLQAADAEGIDRIAVRTVRGGFIVPDSVWDAYQESRAQTGAELIEGANE